MVPSVAKTLVHLSSLETRKCEFFQSLSVKMYKICNSHGLNSVQKSILLFGGKIPGDNAFLCFECRKFFVFYFPPKPPRKVRQNCREIYRSQCSTWRRAEPCWPIKALPKGRGVSVSTTVVMETCHSVLHLDKQYKTLHAIHRLLIA